MNVGNSDLQALLDSAWGKNGESVSALLSPYTRILDAARFLLLAWDGDSEHRHHCGVGDEVWFPALRDSSVNSIAEARATVEAAVSGQAKAEEWARAVLTNKSKASIPLASKEPTDVRTSAE